MSAETVIRERETFRETRSMEASTDSWARAYWAILVIAPLILFPLALVEGRALEITSTAFESMDIKLPMVTAWYLNRGAGGVMGGALVSIVVIAGLASVRRHLAGVIISGAALVLGALYLTIGVLAFFAPLVSTASLGR